MKKTDPMNKCYEEMLQSLQQALEISEGTIPVAPMDGVPANNTQETISPQTKKYRTNKGRS